MAGRRTTPLPPLPWLVAALVLGAALAPLPSGPWRTGMAAILVLAWGTRALPWLGFLCGGMLLAGGHAGPAEADPLPTRVDLWVTVRSPERPQEGGEQVTEVAPRYGPVPERRWFLREPDDHGPRLRGEVLRVLAPATPSGDGSRITLRVTHPDQVQRGPSPGAGPWLRLRRTLDQGSRGLAARLDARLAPLTGGLVAALLRGETGRLAPSDRDLLRRCGVWHLLVVSGLHVALLGRLLEVLLACWLRPRPATAITLLVLVTFVLWTGARPPVVRATLVLVAARWSHRARRPGPSTAALALAFLLLVSARPETLGSVGAQLSFLAVLGIGASTSLQFAGSPRGTGSGFQPWRPFQRALVVSAGACLATLPWCAWHFGSFSPWSPLCTLLFGPLLLVLAAGALALLAVEPLVPGFAAVLGPCLDLLAEAIRSLATHVDRWPGTPCAVPAPPVPWLAAWLVALLLLQGRRFGAAFLALLLGLGLGVAGPDHRGDRATLLDVGQGQCLWVRADGGDWLVDAGAMTDTARLRARRDLARRGVWRLDGAFASHLDADHCRFLERWVRDGFVRQLLLSAAHRPEWQDPGASPTVRGLREAARAAGIPVRFLAAGARAGPFQVLWPPPRRRFLADNDGSLVLSFRLAQRRVLAPGDVSDHALVEVAARVGPHALVLLPHHGNPDPSLGALLARSRPLAALASRGQHLDPGPREQLREARVAWRVTAGTGAVELPSAPPGAGGLSPR